MKKIKTSIGVMVLSMLLLNTPVVNAAETKSECEHNAGIVIQENIKASTCTTYGSYDEVTYCEYCGDEMSRKKHTTKPSEHTYRYTKRKATCVSKGSITYICTVCSYSYDEPIPIDKKAHTTFNNKRVEPTCTVNGYEQTTCAHCEEVISTSIIPALKHIYHSETKEPELTENGYKKDVCDRCGDETNMEILPMLAKTHEPYYVFTDNTTNGKYKVITSDVAGGTVVYLSPDNKTKSKVTIPAEITYDGIKYKVIEIAEMAFQKNNRVKTIIIGSNIKTIGNKAFDNCKKLKKIEIKTKKLTKKTLASNTFTGIKKKTIIKVPKSKVKTYKKLFKQKGLSKNIKVK